MNIISCNAPYRVGGMGWCLANVVEEARARGNLCCYFASTVKPNDPAGREISLKKYRWFFRSPPLRYRHGWRDFLAGELWDRAVAHRLTPANEFTGFGGKARHSFSRARGLKFEKLMLESVTSHVINVRSQHGIAAKRYPIEESWLSPAQFKKTLREYAQAEEITVISKYARQTFLEAGIPESKVHRRFIRIASRFAPPLRRMSDETFRIVYVGRLQVSKGVPVLVEAFRHLNQKKAELVLVGGFATIEMESYLRRQIALDSRIQLCSGDPLSFFHKADVVVNPSFEDGLGIAPLEALACGVPVIVTEDTGMKEFIVDGTNGYAVPTGDVDALVDQLKNVSQHPLRDKFEPLRMSEDMPSNPEEGSPNGARRCGAPFGRKRA